MLESRFLPEGKALIRMAKEPQTTLWPESMAHLPVLFIGTELSFTDRGAKNFVGVCWGRFFELRTQRHSTMSFSSHSEAGYMGIM